MSRIASCLFALLLGCSTLAAADWPTYRGDAARSGYTAEKLPAKLSAAWIYQPVHGPTPAWPRDDRMLFDRVHDVVVAQGTLLYGSSADGRIVAFDAQTAEPRWTFFTGAPVRFAPTVWQDRVYAVSDDGYLYCLALADGQLVQKWRGGPSDEMILGNGRMVSRWPARGGPVVVDGILYFGAGVWQSDGIYLRAIDLETGKIVWENDDAGSIYMPQPHGGANAESGVSVQGYLAATENKLLVPTGRAVPAAFNRHDGSFQYYHLQANGHVGGTQTIAAAGSFFNGGCAFDLETGNLEAKLGPGSFAAFPGMTIHAGKRELRVLEKGEKTSPDRKGVPTTSVVHKATWSVPLEETVAVIVAGETIVAGGGKTVSAIDTKTKQITWTAEVDGVPYGLAVADGRLYVSTDKGSIYCFDGGEHAQPKRIVRTATAIAKEERSAAAADEILRTSGVKEGFCLDLDCRDVGVVAELARRTDLQIYALNSSADEVAALRQQLSDAGLYGTRVTVHQGDAKNHPYGKYFADLVIASASLDLGALDISADDPPTALRPFGGVAVTGKLGEMQIVRRGALAKTGSWTHQYSDPGNTSCSADELVKGELHALWFRDVDLEMPQRHGRGHAPLFHEGRMFVEGLDALRAVDAYNGRNLWEFSLPGIQRSYDADHLSGTSVTGSNLCLAGNSVFVHDKKFCYRLDAATGKKLGQFPAPNRTDGKEGVWGYIACDGERLYGSLVNTAHRVRFGWRPADMSDQWGESTTLFALDPKSGKLLWRYDAGHSIRNNAIALGSDQVFLIDRPIAAEDVLKPGYDPKKKLPPVAKVDQKPGKLLSLDAATGKLRWQSDAEAFGTMLAYSRQHDALLMGYQSTRFKLPSEVGGQLAVFRGKSGQPIWQKEAKYVTRPLINDRTIYAQGGAWDLLTGEEQPFVFERSYGCGQIAASKHMLLFRSATLGYLDLNRGSGVENYGGIRPGCWINALPVGGLVLLPDASAGCQCSYQNRSWMALTGDEE